jgi:hypothetical protein
MKKITTIALAAIMVLGLGACSKEGKNPQQPGMARLTVQLKGVKAAQTTRSTEPGADADDLSIDETRSMIFVADPTGHITQAVAIDVSQAVAGAGQVIPDPVAIGSSVYVVANIPAADFDDVKVLTDLEELQGTAVAISTQTDFTTPAMANASGTATTVTGTETGGKVNISIKPLFARLELVALQAKADNSGNLITDFDVTGVFLDNYFDEFDQTGAVPAGSVAHSLPEDLEAAADETAKAAVFTNWAVKDVLGPWGATGSPAIVQLTDEVWGYNVVASGLPRLIVRVENVVYTSAQGVAGLSRPGVFYLTVKGYYDETEDEEITEFVRGEVYRIGALTAGVSNAQFSYANLQGTPDEETKAITVGVTAEPWSVKDFAPIF